MSNVIKLKKKYEVTLRKLAAGLRADARKMRLFDMEDFLPEDDKWVFDGEGNDYVRPEPIVAECGSVGCAVGHATRICAPIGKAEGWYDYSIRLFGIGTATKTNREKGYQEWEWCFGGFWRDYDNTPNGAASRIDYLLDFGLPVDFDEWPEHHHLKLYRKPKLYVSPQTEAMFPSVSKGVKK